jgi:hypothetical protein
MVDAPWQPSVRFARDLGPAQAFSAAVGVALFDLTRSANLKGQDIRVFKASIAKTAYTGAIPRLGKPIRRRHSINRLGVLSV